MRRFLSIVKATALEILSEPLTLLILLAALVLTVVMPIFHYHQFGEATRMARDAALSALLTCGGVVAVFGTIRTFRREIESGTLEMALAHPISRGGFFVAKTLGAFAAYLVFALIVGATGLTSLLGAEVGGKIAERTGDLARVWGPCVAAGLATMVLSLILAAAFNRFARCRFVLSAVVLMVVFAVLSAVGFAVLTRSALVVRVLPALFLLVFLAAFWIVAAASSAVRLKANAAASLTGLMLVVTIPFLGNYYRADALANGGEIAWSFVVFAALALVPAVVGLGILGMRLMHEGD